MTRIMYRVPPILCLAEGSVGRELAAAYQLLRFPISIAGSRHDWLKIESLKLLMPNYVRLDRL